MIRVSVLILVVSLNLGAWSGECSPTPDPVEVACLDTVLVQAEQLFRAARFGLDDHERGAFIVRDSGGGYSFELWPSTAEYRRASFDGRMPAGTVAIIHTHPNEREYPSVADEAQAARLGIPVYVITRARIAKADGHTVQSVWTGNWKKRRDTRSAVATCASGAPLIARQDGDRGFD